MVDTRYCPSTTLYKQVSSVRQRRSGSVRLRRVGHTPLSLANNMTRPDVEAVGKRPQIVIETSTLEEGLRSA